MRRYRVVSSLVVSSLVVSSLGLLVACSSDATTSSGGGQGAGAAGATGGTGGTGGTATGTGASGGTGGSGTGTGGMGTGGASTGGAGATGGAGGQGGGSGTPCTWQDGVNPCGAGMYCDAPGCGQGFCAPVTNVDDTVKVPVCGCDGVDYWNAVTASNHGMAVAAMGMCPTSKFCGGFGNLPCPDNAHYCAFDVGTAVMCGASDVGGSCWGMPLTCNTVGFGGQHRACANPSGPCQYECEAIKSQQTYWGPDGTCPQ